MSTLAHKSVGQGQRQILVQWEGASQGILWPAHPKQSTGGCFEEENERSGCSTMALTQSWPPFALSAKGLCQHGYLCVECGLRMGEANTDRWTREDRRVMASSAQPPCVTAAWDTARGGLWGEHGEREGKHQTQTSHWNTKRKQ